MWDRDCDLPWVGNCELGSPADCPPGCVNACDGSDACDCGCGSVCNWVAACCDFTAADDDDRVGAVMTSGI